MKYLILPFILLLSGCLQTRTDVKAGEQGKVLQQQVSTLQKTNADVSSRFEEAEEQIRFLNGRVEALENQISQTKQESESVKRSSSETIQSQAQKMSIFQEALTKMEMEQDKVRSEMQALKSALQADSTPTPSAPTQSKNTFDVAEALFAKKDFRQAILEYQKYREKFPKGKNVTVATYKMGVCFQELGLKDDAKAFYEEVISKSPKSDEAKKSKVRLQKLK